MVIVLRSSLCSGSLSLWLLHTTLTSALSEHTGEAVRLPCTLLADTIPAMTNELPPEVERHLALCKRIYEDMEEDGSWPWAEKSDSPDSEDLIESEDNTSQV